MEVGQARRLRGLNVGGELDALDLVRLLAVALLQHPEETGHSLRAKLTD